MLYALLATAVLAGIAVGVVIAFLLPIRTIRNLAFLIGALTFIFPTIAGVIYSPGPSYTAGIVTVSFVISSIIVATFFIANRFASKTKPVVGKRSEQGLSEEEEKRSAS